MEIIEAINAVLTDPTQMTITIVGGIVFGLGLITARKATVGELPDSEFRVFITYIMSNFLLFYFTFPFAQGFLWLVQSGHWDRLVIVTATYWIYMGFFFGTVYLLRRWKHRGDR